MELSAVGGSYPRCLPYVAGAGTCDELTCSGSTCHSSELPLAKFGLATWLLLDLVALLLSAWVPLCQSFLPVIIRLFLVGHLCLVVT